MILPGRERRNRAAGLLLKVSNADEKLEIQNWKCGSLGKDPRRLPPSKWPRRKSYYSLLGDSPVTTGKSLRWLQSSQEPSYIFAS